MNVAKMQRFGSVAGILLFGFGWIAHCQSIAADFLPAEPRAKEAVVKTSGGLSPEWTNRTYRTDNLWAYQPLPPRHTPADENLVDYWVDRALESNSLVPSRRASRRTLIRRATFDLTGLPPTPSQVEDFLRDPAEDRVAFANLVDRLLESPHYGEQWGRHWLDVVRYADTAGFANDYERPNAWRYRDYVIRAFNNDKPYDRFIIEQLAGDELDDSDPENLVATGFLRMGPWEQTGMSVAKVTRQLFLDDITNNVGQVFLSHPLRCARCHDHKYDPIPTRDYYSIQAVFATTQFADRDAAFLEDENRGEFEEEQQRLEDRIERYEQILAEIRSRHEKAARKWYADRDIEYASEEELKRLGVKEEEIAPRHLGLSTLDFGLERIGRKYLERHRWEQDRFRPIAFSVYSGPTHLPPRVHKRMPMPKNPEKRGDIEETAILSGGDVFSPTLPVEPGIMSCVTGTAGQEAELPDTIPNAVAGRRLALARWIAHPHNPLSTRSIVNRVWQYHFGRGLAANPNNFGATGGKPTHPQLLDELTLAFLEQDWSIKDLHRLIMNSDTYCRVSPLELADDAPENVDSEGEFYGTFQPRRLTAEEIRDAMLMVSKELNPSMGGIPIRPDINLEVAMQPRQVMGTYAPAYQPSPQRSQRNRRSIYAMRIRGLRDPFMEIFNQPGSDSSCERRSESIIAPQALEMFNAQESHDRALAMAVRLLEESHERKETITHAFWLCYARAPTPAEQSYCLDHWRAMTERHQQMPCQPEHPPTEIVRHAIEEMNGEPFEFTEKLESYEVYEPDLKPWDVPPATRALADICLVLLNTNEFLHIP